MTDLRDAMRATAASKDLVAVDVPEWEQKVYIRKLTVRDQKAITATSNDPVDSSLRVLIAAMVDENGEQLLGGEDFDLLMDQPLPLITPLLLEAGRQNGLTAEELQEAVAAFQVRSEQDAPSPGGAGSGTHGRRARGDAGR